MRLQYGQIQGLQLDNKKMKERMDKMAYAHKIELKQARSQALMLAE